MSADGGHFEQRSGSLNTILEVDHLRTIDDMFAILAYWFQRRRLLNIFSIGSYVKIKSSHGGHLEFPIGKRFTRLAQDHPMIIPAKSQFNWFGGF
jgi:hypothetical protein